MGSRPAEVSDGDEAQASRTTPHRTPSSRERAPLHETMVPTGLHAPPEGRDATSQGQDRRLSCRYPVSGTQSVLCWWEPVEVASPHDDRPDRPVRPSEMTIYSAVMARGPAFRNALAMRQGAEARREAAPPPTQETMRLRYSNGAVVDISQTGMAVLCEAIPQPDQKVWLRIAQPQPTDWVEVVLMGVTLAERGPHLIRLAFREACPYDFFKAAVYGCSKP